MKKFMLMFTSLVVVLVFTACTDEENKAEEKKNTKVVEKTMPVIEKKNTKVVEKTMPVLEKKSQELVNSVKKVMANDSIDGAALFRGCVSCHGKNAEKAALGKSKIIKGWDKDRIVNALKGYKDGTYGGKMKNIMRGQAASKSDAEIEALATYISNL